MEKKNGKQLNSDEIFELREAFSAYEEISEVLDDSGRLHEVVKISSKHFEAVLISLGFDFTEAEISDLLYILDKKRTGEVEFKAFVNVIAEYYKILYTEDDLKEIFQTFDSEGFGYLTGKEITNMIRIAFGVTFTDDTVADIVKQADVDCDGKITFDEFLNYCEEIGVHEFEYD